jgi:molecular chaperone DnaK
MVKDAEVNAESDKKQKELITTRNSTEGIVNTIKTELEEYKSKITPDEVAKITEAIERAEEALGKEDITEMQDSVTNLYSVMDPINKLKNTDKPNNEDNVIDAEVV